MIRIMDSLIADEAIFTVRSVGLLLSHYCSENCRHCCFSALKHRDDYDPRVTDCFFTDLPKSLKAVSLTGGEPLDFPDRALDILRRASSANLACSIVTSGSFSRDWPKADRWLRQAVEAGLGEIAFSVDAYHRPGLGHAQRLKLISFCLDLGLGVHLKGLGRQSRVLIRKLFEDLGERDSLSFRVADLEPVGRALGLPGDRVGKEDRPCGNIAAPGVFPDGRVFSCCSVFEQEMAESALFLGNILDQPLGQLIDRHQRDYMVAALLFLGPAEMRSWLTSRTRNRLPGDSGCASCIGMMRDAEAVSELQRHLASDRELRKSLHGFGMLSDSSWQTIEMPNGDAK